MCVSWRIHTWHVNESFVSHTHTLTHIWIPSSHSSWTYDSLSLSLSLSLSRFFLCHTICVKSHMNESCLIWMSHVLYEWVMSHMNEMGHVRIVGVSDDMWYVPYEWVMGVTRYGICPIWMSHVSYECVTCRMYEWVMSHVNKSRHTYELVMSHDMLSRIYGVVHIYIYICMFIYICIYMFICTNM